MWPEDQTIPENQKIPTFPDIHLAFSIDTLIELTHIFNEANNLQRWNDCLCDSSYNELNKQALNCATAFSIARYCEKAGWVIDDTKFPKIALGRICAKVTVYYDVPEHNINKVCKIGGFAKSELDKAVKKEIEKRTSPEFAEFVWENASSVEVRIYRAATKIATFLELNELKENYESMKQKEDEIQKSLQEFWDIPGVKELSNTASHEYQILKDIASLRNSNRWAARFYPVDCSVLGHLFDTASYAYIMSLLRGESEEQATKLFWIGIFHDIAERWTKDIPSNVKAMIDGFRDATEEYERQVLDEHVYSLLPDWLAAELKAMSMEDSSNESLKLMAKEADYISAERECVANLIGGSRDRFWIRMILKVNRKFVTPEAKQMHQRFADYASKVEKTMPEL